MRRLSTNWTNGPPRWRPDLLARASLPARANLSFPRLDLVRDPLDASRAGLGDVGLFIALASPGAIGHHWPIIGWRKPPARERRPRRVHAWGLRAARYLARAHSGHVGWRGAGKRGLVRPRQSIPNGRQDRRT